MKDGKLTGEIRKMTRERAGDEFEEMRDWAKRWIDGLKLAEYYRGFADWRDVTSNLNFKIAGRKDRLHETLSDAAIG